MISDFFSHRGIRMYEGLALIRIVTSIFLIYHGWEVFDQEKMNGYAKWLGEMQFTSPLIMGYAGKGAELLAGLLLLLGFLTRVAVILLITTMLIITFGIGQGRIFMEEQHPFLFILLGLLFFFTGPGKWSLDEILFHNKSAPATKTR